ARRPGFARGIDRRRARILGDAARGAPLGERSGAARRAWRRTRRDRARGLPLLSAQMGALLGQANPPDAVAALLREALLLDAQLVLEGGEALGQGDEA